MYFPRTIWDFTPLAGFGRLRTVLIFLTLFYLVVLAEKNTPESHAGRKCFSFLVILCNVLNFICGKLFYVTHGTSLFPKGTVSPGSLSLCEILAGLYGVTERSEDSYFGNKN